LEKTKFFELINRYRRSPRDFSVYYTRATLTRKILQKFKRNILREVHMEKHLIEDKGVPLRQDNDNYIRDLLETKYYLYCRGIQGPLPVQRPKKGEYV